MFKYLPHIYRIITAGFFLLLASTAFLGPLPFFERLKLGLVKDYQYPKNHLDLAREYKKVNDLEEAKKELLIGLSFNPDDKELKEELGKIAKLQKQPQEILEEINLWEKTARDFPGYRDAYLKLTGLYYQLYQNDRAQDNLEKALLLDPNYEPAKDLQRVLEGNN